MRRMSFVFVLVLISMSPTVLAQSAGDTSKTTPTFAFRLRAAPLPGASAATEQMFITFEGAPLDGFAVFSAPSGVLLAVVLNSDRSPDEARNSDWWTTYVAPHLDRRSPTAPIQMRTRMTDGATVALAHSRRPDADSWLIFSAFRENQSGPVAGRIVNGTLIVPRQFNIRVSVQLDSFTCGCGSNPPPPCGERGDGCSSCIVCSRDGDMCGCCPETTQECGWCGRQVATCGDCPLC